MTDMSEYYMGNSVQHWYAKLDRIKEEKAELSLALARVKELEAQYAKQDENNRLLVELQLENQAQAAEIARLKAENLAMRKKLKRYEANDDMEPMKHMSPY